MTYIQLLRYHLLPDLFTLPWEKIVMAYFKILSHCRILHTVYCMYVYIIRTILFMFMNLFFLRFVHIFQEMVIKSHTGGRGVHRTLHPHSAILPCSSIRTMILCSFFPPPRFMLIFQEIVMKTHIAVVYWPLDSHTTIDL
jgi:hypothetical protein